VSIQHPLPIGTPVQSLCGEQADDEDGNILRAPLGATGTVISVDEYRGGHPSPQGWTYGVQFPDGPWVFIDQLNGIDDPLKYRVTAQETQ
jgi:hypothetical protein